jgi:hypothetical protein
VGMPRIVTTVRVMTTIAPAAPATRDSAIEAGTMAAVRIK